MTRLPVFANEETYRAGRRDVALWQPLLDEVLRRHDLPGGEPVAGYNPTYPTFLVGDAVVKFHGFSGDWRRSHAAERAAHALLVTDPGIGAPRVLGAGSLGASSEAPWLYLITTRLPGRSWQDSPPAAQERIRLARELGAQVRRIHSLRPESDVCTLEVAALDVTAAAARSSLPPHLVAQAADYVRSLPAPDPVFVHGDLCGMHAFVSGGRLVGIIDWGDALVADRHYELIQIHRDTFDCDKAQLRAFLEASAWPLVPDLPRRALGQALVRQATGLLQHLGMDVFEPVAAHYPLAEIATLDELAVLLFGL